MAEAQYWADVYVEKKRDAESAIRLIRSGQRVFIGSACGEPQELVRGLADHANLLPAWKCAHDEPGKCAPYRDRQ